jgi:hypothetical protein
MFGRGQRCCSTVKPPVIVLGMHRSGTTLVAEILRDLGLFQGRDADLNEHCEPVFFVEANEALLRLGSATWDHPEAFNELARNPEIVPGLLPSLRVHVERSLVQLSGREGANWGWKDPRTVYTLPLWLKLFPDARLLYIVRNGVDVAASLRTRELERQECRRRHDAERARIRPLDEAFAGSARCLSLNGSYALWEEYIEQAECALGECGNERLALRFETLLSDPQEHIRRMAAFCDLPGASPESIAAAAARVRTARANAFLGNPELEALHRIVRNRPAMARNGYGSAVEGELRHPDPQLSPAMSV